MIAIKGRKQIRVGNLTMAALCHRPCEVLDDDGKWIARIDARGGIWREPDAGSRRAEEAYAGKILPLNAASS